MRVALVVVTVLVAAEARSVQQPDDELMGIQKESGRLSDKTSVQIAADRERRFFSSLLGMAKKFLPTIMKHAPKILPTIIKHAPKIINMVTKAPGIIKTVKKFVPKGIAKALPTILKHAPTILKAAPSVIKMLTGGTGKPNQTVIKVKEKVQKKPLFSAGECPNSMRIAQQKH